jgi:hypothetical protein
LMAFFHLLWFRFCRNFESLLLFNAGIEAKNCNVIVIFFVLTGESRK